MAGRIELINLEFGYPRADEAGRRLTTELELARKKGVALLKIVHGYGSGGKGGRIRTAVRALLLAQERAGAIGAVVPGEGWSIFDESSRGLIDRYPKLREDVDLERSNPGITLVELTRRRARA